MGIQNRLPFELDSQVDESLITAHAGVPLVVELFRSCGAAEVMERRASPKQRDRGLKASEMAEGLYSLWLSGGERCEDLDRLREDEALAVLLGHPLPAARTMRTFLEAFHEEDLPLLQTGEQAVVSSESALLEGLAAVSGQIVRCLQAQQPQTVATLDVDATILESDKQAAKPTYDGRRGYQPVFVRWAEQDLIVADEFRDGNVPAGSGNLRVVQKALAALPPGITEVRVRGDSALYEQKLLDELSAHGRGFAISADMSRPLRAVIEALPEEAWQLDTQEADAVRQWSEVVFVSDEQRSPQPYRYLAIRILKKQGSLFADGTDRRHFAVVTNMPGDGLELIRWHRVKAGSIEHSHDVLTNELAAEALPSQKFGANAAWVRLNVILYNLLSALKRLTLPADLRAAKPKRLRFLLFNTVGRVIRHARETLLRLSCGPARKLFDEARVVLSALSPPLPAV
ncbi:MAG: IS1380 family transposase [Acidobacteria bacterium]|nr:IS1380 family transposase [Acidobacteriota bacterium]